MTPIRDAEEHPTLKVSQESAPRAGDQSPTPLLTRNQLQPPADVEHRRGLAEAEEQHGADGEEGGEDGEAHAGGGRHERRVLHEHELLQLAGALLAVLVGVARGPQAELARGLALRVAHPLGGHEGHDADDGVAYREYGPEHADGFGVADVPGGVDLRRVHVLDLGTHLRSWGSVGAVSLPGMCHHGRQDGRRATGASFA